MHRFKKKKKNFIPYYLSTTSFKIYCKIGFYIIYPISTNASLRHHPEEYLNLYIFRGHQGSKVHISTSKIKEQNLKYSNGHTEFCSYQHPTEKLNMFSRTKSGKKLIELCLLDQRSCPFP